MSKERLEEIEERVIYGTDSEDMKVDVWVELKDYEYLKEQAEHVEELAVALNDARKEIFRLKNVKRVDVEHPSNRFF